MYENLNWVDFYEELSTNLLAYKDSPNELALIVQELIAKNQTLEYLKLNAVDVICDPFSILATFNRPISSEIRFNIAFTLAGILKVKTNVPKDFSIIPTININTPIFNGNFECWRLLELAINCAKYNNFTADFYISLDSVVGLEGNTLNNIATVLSWIRPNTFLNLSTSVIEFLSNRDNNINTIIDIFPEILIGKTPTTFHYTNMCIQCKRIIEINDLNFKNFAQMYSYIKAIANSNYTNYWWLNVNSNTWNFSSSIIGERKNYTLINEQGNYRRIHKNFINAKNSDTIIVYEATPVKKIIGLAKVVQQQNGENITFEKTKDLARPIPYEILKEYNELYMMEFFQNPHGSLFKLTKAEYDFIITLTEDGTIEKVTKPTVNFTVETYTKTDFLKDVYMTSENYDTITTILKRKKNIILQGCSGVGKTYLSKKLAYSLIGEPAQKQVELTQFHQRYSYEDFLLGFKTTEHGTELSKGIFYSFCKTAQDDIENDYYFIIDEINRGDIDNIFGEVFSLIEKDKRNAQNSIKLINRPSERFYIPENVYIIGIVNNVVNDQVLDLSLRRRFAFFDIQPAFDTQQFIDYQASIKNEKFDKLILLIKELNNLIKHDEHLGIYLQISHSYFIEKDTSIINDIWLDTLIKYEIIPLIQEYWYNDTQLVHEWVHKLLDSIK